MTGERRHDRGDEGNEVSSEAIVVAPGTTVGEINAMLRAMGGSPGEDGEEMFPRGPRRGHCRVCGEFTDLPEEHVPPRGAFNTVRGREFDPMASIGDDSLDPPDEGRDVQGGIRGHVLCARCNNPKWTREYQEWANRALTLLRSQPVLPHEVDIERGDPHFEGEVTFKAVYPGRLIRQVLSMMASISGSSSLATRYPVIRELVSGGAPQPLPDPLRVEFLLYGDTTARLAGGPTGQPVFDKQRGTLTRVLQIDFVPLAFILTIEGPPPGQGVDITCFSEVPVDQKQDVTFDGLALGFGHKPWPCDYRTRGQMELDATNNGDLPRRVLHPSTDPPVA